MPGTLKVGGNIIASHTGVEGAGTVTLGNVVLGDSAVPTNNYTFRNLLINGAAQISQRGDVTGVSSTTYGGPDRFQHIMASAGTFSISQSTDAPDGFSNSIKVACTSSTSLSTGSLYLLGQKIEGQNVQHLEYGSSTAKSLTFSFWVKTNVSGDYAVEFFSQTANRQISKSFNISSAEASAFSWVKRTMTIPGDTVTALPNNNTAEHAFYIWLCAGTDYTSGTLNSSAWASNTNANRALPMNLGSSTSNEFYLTGVQLEEGSVATPFEHRPYGLELSLCQRYYHQERYNGEGSPINLMFGLSLPNATYKWVTARLPVTMHHSPTVTFESGAGNGFDNKVRHVTTTASSSGSDYTPYGYGATTQYVLFKSYNERGAAAFGFAAGFKEEAEL